METALNTYVNSKTLIGEVVRDYPESIDVLMADRRWNQSRMRVWYTE